MIRNCPLEGFLSDGFIFFQHVKIVTWKVSPFKFRSRSWNTTFVMVHFSSEYQPLWKSCDQSQALTIFLDIRISIFVTLKCMSRSRYTTFAVKPFHGKCMTSCLMAIVMFALYVSIHEMTSCLMAIVMFALYVSIHEIFVNEIKMPKVWLWKWMSRSRRRKTEPATFDWQYLIQYWWTFSEF